jgi:hypothetical protein
MLRGESAHPESDAGRMVKPKSQELYQPQPATAAESR